MKKILLIAVLLLVAYSLFAQFRNTKWGMSIDEVKQTENAEPLFYAEKSFPKALMYREWVLGIKKLLGFYFVDNQLVRAGYGFLGYDTNYNQYIYDYNELKEALYKKYKTAIDDKILWKNDLYKDNRSKWGYAISLGHLVYFAKWETKDTNIIIILEEGSEHSKCFLTLEYTSKELKALEEKGKQKEMESKL